MFSVRARDRRDWISERAWFEHASASTSSAARPPISEAMAAAADWASFCPRRPPMKATMRPRLLGVASAGKTKVVIPTAK